MTNKYYIGSNVNSLSKSEEQEPYKKLSVIVGTDDNGNQIVHRAYVNDQGAVVQDPSTAEYDAATGRELVITNPWATPAITAEILTRIKGYRHHPFSANDAFVPDQAELGDGITIGDIYSVLVNQDITFDGLSASNISSPGADETENEFGLTASTSKVERDIIRKTNTISTKFTVELGKIESEIYDPETGLSSRITQNANAITSEVTRASGVEGTLSSRITQNADAITSEVTRASGAEGQLSTRIDQRLDSITLSVSSNGGSSTFTILDDNVSIATQTLNMTVDTAHISGALTADSIIAKSCISSPEIIGGRYYDNTFKYSPPPNSGITFDLAGYGDPNYIYPAAKFPGKYYIDELTGYYYMAVQNPARWVKSLDTCPINLNRSSMYLNYSISTANLVFGLGEPTLPGSSSCFFGIQADYVTQNVDLYLGMYNILTGTRDPNVNNVLTHGTWRFSNETAQILKQQMGL